MIVRERPTGWKLFLIMRGSVLPRIRNVLLINLALSIAVTLAHGVLFAHKITLTPIPFTLIGLALAIFLGFRNNVSYDRYWEGRKLWGTLVYSCRNLARECLSLIDPTGHERAGAAPLDEVGTRMIYRAIAYVHALRQRLRGTPDAGQLRPWLREAEWRQLNAEAPDPNQLMLAMGRDLQQCLADQRIDPCLAASINATLNDMVAAATGCERIRNTPIPFSYTLLLHRTAYLYCFMLPFGLVDTIGFMTPVVVSIVAYTFFGLDALGDEIEEPFGTSPNDLPLDAICRAIESELRAAVGDPSPPPPLQPVNYCLL
ncbi:putative membrane protein [Noviherbaspirillum humi]|uniref:Putative membrane protein n=1 Tax=Noviherbaspirillum humi TaxID=1688639 RepID=A0A239IBV9_9BURK|nr:bestrophin family protein [Noviherbaspirillum humi]SNS91110.1 putative membrane protein [Noviherbaspirillum humi]